MAKQKKISVFDYTDFRQYLRDFYKQEKSASKSFSYRSFAIRAGFNSSGLYKDVVDGRRDLNNQHVFQFCKAMKLTGRQVVYFENMVGFDQAKTVEQRNQYFGRMMKVHNGKVYKIEADRYEYYSKWYYSAIRELAGTGMVTNDFGKVARTLNPVITPERAKKAVKILLKLGMIKKNKTGRYVQVQSAITTGPDVKSLNVANFQKAMMRLADEAIDRHPAKNRDISTLTLSISKKRMDEFKSEIVAFRKRLAGMAESNAALDSVFQFNMQFFPLSKIEK